MGEESRTFTYVGMVPAGDLRVATEQYAAAAGCESPKDLDPGSSYLVLKAPGNPVEEVESWLRWLEWYPDACEGTAVLRLSGPNLDVLRLQFRLGSRTSPIPHESLVSIAVTADDHDRLEQARSLFRSLGNHRAIEETVPRPNGKGNGHQILRSGKSATPAAAANVLRTATSNRIVFIGHGGQSTEWKDLRRFLEKFTIEILTFETDQPAGRVVTSILDGMVARAEFALLVFTAEDETAGGMKRARQNVVHETGLFQAKLGFEKAIVLREDGVEEPSNLFGLQFLSFRQGHISGTYDAVLELLRKNFPDIGLRSD